MRKFWENLFQARWFSVICIHWKWIKKLISMSADVFLRIFWLTGFLNLHLLALNQYDLTKILCSVFGGGIQKNIRKNLLNYLMNLIAVDIWDNLTKTKIKQHSPFMFVCLFTILPQLLRYVFNIFIYYFLYWQIS